MTVRSEGTTTRGHGDGSLFMRRQGRGKGRWVAVVTLRDGRRASRTARTREEAKAALAELLRLRDARAPVTRNIRLSDYLARWLDDGTRGLASATRRKHDSIVRTHLVPALGHYRLSEMRPADVERALAQLPVGQQSRRHVRATLRRALADALRDGLVERNVAALARPEGLPHKERTILDANQARILIESTRNTVYGPLWTMLVTTGMRISEALGLSWSDVDFGGNDAVLDRPAVGAVGVPQRAVVPGVGRRYDPKSSGGPAITVRRQLAREAGEWVHRPPKTAKGRRTIPLTPLGVEALRAQRTQQREWMAAYYGGDDETRHTRSAVAFAGDGAPRGEAAYQESETASQGAHQGAGRPRLQVTGNLDTLGSPPRARGGRDGVAATAGDSRRAPVQPIDGLVFTTSRGKPLHETNTLAALHKALAEAGLPKVSQHSLRHLAATIWYSQGLPIEAIADLLGHSTVRVTQDLYRHHVQEFSVLAAERMQEALGG